MVFWLDGNLKFFTWCEGIRCCDYGSLLVNQQSNIELKAVKSSIKKNNYICCQPGFLATRLNFFLNNTCCKISLHKRNLYHKKTLKKLINKSKTKINKYKNKTETEKRNVNKFKKKINIIEMIKCPETPNQSVMIVWTLINYMDGES